MLPTLQVCQDFVQGDSFELKVSHNPVPSGGISGAIFELILKNNTTGASVLYKTYTVPSGTDATNGIAYIPVSSSDTDDIAAGEYYGTLKRKLPGGEFQTIIRSEKGSVKKVKVYKNLQNT